MNDKNRWILGLLSVLIGLFIFIEVMVQFDIWEILSQYSKFSLHYLALYLLISVGIIFALIFRWMYILKSFGYKTSFHDLFSFRMAGYAIGYLTPSAHVGGEPIRAYYLKKKYGIPMSVGLSSVLVDRALEFSGDALFAFIGLMVLIFNFTISKNQTFAIILAIAAFSISLFLFYYNASRGKGTFSRVIERVGLTRYPMFRRIYKFLCEMEGNISFFFRKRKRYLFISIGFTTLLWVLMFLEYKTALAIVGVDASVATIFLVLTFVGLAYVVPIPAALGALEAGQVSVFSLLSIGKAKAIALAFLIRGRDMIWVIYGGVTILLRRHHLFEDLKLNKSKKVKKKHSNTRK